MLKCFAIPFPKSQSQAHTTDEQYSAYDCVVDSDEVGVAKLNYWCKLTMRAICLCLFPRYISLEYFQKTQRTSLRELL